MRGVDPFFSVPLTPAMAGRFEEAEAMQYMRLQG
jgi:hypothetical protein